MSTKSRSRALRAAMLAGLVAVSPAIAACGGSSNASPKASVTVGSGGANVSVSVPPTSAAISAGKSIASQASSAAHSAGLTVGQNVTLTGTVASVLIPGGYLFLLQVQGQSQPVPVGTATATQVKEGDTVTVKGQVAQVTPQQLQQLAGSFGTIPPSAQQKLQQLQGAKIVHATSVTKS